MKIKEYGKLNYDLLKGIYKQYRELNGTDTVETVESDRTYTYVPSKKKYDLLDISVLFD